MNDSEIIKALECCTTTKGGCKECPMKGYEKVDCQLIAATEAYKLINRQQAEIERLNIELKTMRGAANGFKAEVEKLQTEKDLFIRNYSNFQKELLKEFAERVKTAFCAEFDELIPSIMADKIDEIYKEMVGENNA